jgi:hypothetical protein
MGTRPSASQTKLSKQRRDCVHSNQQQGQQGRSASKTNERTGNTKTKSSRRIRLPAGGKDVSAKGVDKQTHKPSCTLHKEQAGKDQFVRGYFSTQKFRQTVKILVHHFFPCFYSTSTRKRISLSEVCLNIKVQTRKLTSFPCQKKKNEDGIARIDLPEHVLENGKHSC